MIRKNAVRKTKLNLTQTDTKRKRLDKERQERMFKAQKIKKEFEKAGVSIQDWATKNNCNPHLVYDLLSGRTEGKRGQAHHVAIKLGLKEEVVSFIVVKEVKNETD